MLVLSSLSVEKVYKEKSWNTLRNCLDDSNSALPGMMNSFK